MKAITKLHWMQCRPGACKPAMGIPCWSVGLLNGTGRHVQVGHGRDVGPSAVGIPRWRQSVAITRRETKIFWVIKFHYQYEEFGRNNHTTNKTDSKLNVLWELCKAGTQNPANVFMTWQAEGPFDQIDAMTTKFVTLGVILTGAKSIWRCQIHNKCFEFTLLIYFISQSFV